MRAFVVTKYREPLREADVPEPIVGDHDVLVQVQAAGQRRGRWYPAGRLRARVQDRSGHTTASCP